MQKSVQEYENGEDSGSQDTNSEWCEEKQGVKVGRGRVGRGRNIEKDSMDLDYCQGINTIV